MLSGCATTGTTSTVGVAGGLAAAADVGADELHPGNANANAAAAKSAVFMPPPERRQTGSQGRQDQVKVNSSSRAAAPWQKQTAAPAGLPPWPPAIRR